MQRPDDADQWFAQFGLSDVARFSDPACELYRDFNLQHGSLAELGHPRVWWRWLQAARSRGAGWQGSHWRQLTGVFLVDGDRVLAEVRHRHSAARPDYLAIVRSGLTGGYNA